MDFPLRLHYFKKKTHFSLFYKIFESEGTLNGLVFPPKYDRFAGIIGVSLFCEKLWSPPCREP